MDKTTLRNSLFEKYFEVEDGILVTDLIDKLSFVKEVWNNLRFLLEKNVKHYGATTPLEGIKTIEHNQKKYLIIKEFFWHYIIIDLEKNQSINAEEFKNTFDEEFFLKNFNEEKVDNSAMFPRVYSIDEYSGDVQELLNFYIENENILSSANSIFYKIQIDDAYTQFYIDFVTPGVQLIFETPDQFLYDQLFMHYDLSPRGLQDATEKIGYERILEMFEKVKEIKIPVEIIPHDLYEIYLSKSNSENTNLKKTRKPNK